MKTGTNELNVLARELLRWWTIYSGKGEKGRRELRKRNTAEMLTDWRTQGDPGVSHSGEGVIQTV